MTEPTLPAVVLAVHVGDLHVRAVLFDLVDGVYRQIASARSMRRLGNDLHPDHLVEVAWVVIRRVEQISGRQLLDEAGNVLPRRGAVVGADNVVCAIGGGPRVGVIGLTADLSTALAARAAGDVGDVVDVLAIAEPETANALTEHLLALLTNKQPDVLVLAGGVDGGATTPIVHVAERLAALLPYVPDTKPAIIFAGNQEARGAVEAALGDITDLRHVANVRPRRDVAQPQPLKRGLEQFWVEQVFAEDEGVRRLRSWIGGSFDAGRRVAVAGLSMVATMRGQSVLAIDADAHATTVSVVPRGATPSGHRTAHGYALESVDPAALAKTISALREEPPPTEQIANALGNWWLRPWARQAAAQGPIHDTATRVILQRALAEAAEHGVGVDGVRPDLIVGRGSLFEDVTPHEAASLLLDAVQPMAPCSLAVDAGRILDLAILADTRVPGLATGVVAEDALTHLGIVIAAVGDVSAGQPLGQLRLKYADGREMRIELVGGGVEVIRMPRGARVAVRVEPARGCNLGWGRGQSGKLDVVGGLVGLIVDLRGRPVPGSRLVSDLSTPTLAGATDATPDRRHGLLPARPAQQPLTVSAHLTETIGRLFGRVTPSS